MEEVKSVIDKIKVAGSAITGVFSVLVILYGAFTFIKQGNQTAESSKEIKEVVTDLKNTIDTLKKNNAKELIWDKWLKKGTPEFGDLWSDLWGGLVGIVIAYVIW